MLVSFLHFEPFPTLLLLKPSDDWKEALRVLASIWLQYCTLAFVSFGDLGSLQTLSPYQWLSGVLGSLPLDFCSWTRSTACASSFWVDLFFGRTLSYQRRGILSSFFFVFF